MPTQQELNHSKNIIVSFMHWRPPPAPGAGLGGIFWGESEYGANPYSYLNWLRAYMTAMESLLHLGSASAARNSWLRYKRQHGMHPDSPGQDGAEKAVLVWSTRVDSSVKEWLSHREENQRVFGWECNTSMIAYRRSEMQRIIDS